MELLRGNSIWGTPAALQFRIVFLSKNIMTIIETKTIILPIVLYGCETLSLM
jgi:hypothetical protein